MPHTRRSLLAALGSMLPFGLAATRAGATPTPSGRPLMLQFVPFENAVRNAFADSTGTACRLVEVGTSDLVQAGVQGCHNDRPFAGFSTGHLRITRTSSAPATAYQGVRLYVTTVEVTATGGVGPEDCSRPLDFAALPAAPTFV